MNLLPSTTLLLHLVLTIPYLKYHSCGSSDSSITFVNLRVMSLVRLGEVICKTNKYSKALVIFFFEGH